MVYNCDAMNCTEFTFGREIARETLIFGRIERDPTE